MTLRLRAIAMIAVPVLLVGAGIWFFAAGSNEGTVGAGGLPLIKADTSPVKLPPEEPGGEMMPNADSTVFEAMGANDAADPSMENLRLPEAPNSVPPPVTPDFAGLKTGFTVPSAPPERKVENLFDTTAKTTVTEPVSAPEPAPEPAPVSVSDRYTSGIAPDALKEAAPTPAPVAAKEKTPEPAPAEPAPAAKPIAEPAPVTAQEMEAAELKIAKPLSKPLAKPRPVSTEKQTPAPRSPAESDQPAKTSAKIIAADVANEAYVPQKKTAPAPTPATMFAPAPTASPATGAKTHYIQLSSMPAGGDTAGMWARLRSMYPEPLAGLSPNYQEAAVPGKGAYIRIQAGPLTQEDAAARCRSLRAMDPKAGCLVIRR